MDDDNIREGFVASQKDDSVSYEYRNVKLKAFENEEHEYTRSFLTAKGWVNMGRLVV